MTEAKKPFKPSGAREWLFFRLLTVVMIPLSIWFVVSLICLARADHAAAVAFLGQPVHGCLLIAFLLVGAVHGILGVHDVATDYIYTPARRGMVFGVADTAVLALTLACVWSIVTLMMGA